MISESNDSPRYLYDDDVATANANDACDYNIIIHMSHDDTDDGAANNTVRIFAVHANSVIRRSVFTAAMTRTCL